MRPPLDDRGISGARRSVNYRQILIALPDGVVTDNERDFYGVDVINPMRGPLP